LWVEYYQLTKSSFLALLRPLSSHVRQYITMMNLSSAIATILTNIFRTSYESGIVPEDWKKANVSPIYKKGKKSDPANYCPISLTCVSCKLMEHITTSNIMKHTREQNILYPLQHGFRDRRSCETQLIEFVRDVTNNMQVGKQTDILVTDFSKAFDKVGHQCLPRKLHHYGVQGRTNRASAVVYIQLQWSISERDYMTGLCDHLPITLVWGIYPLNSISGHQARSNTDTCRLLGTKHPLSLGS